MKLCNIFRHFKTITHHRHLVMLGCFRIGLIRQGLTHDLSKYSWTEFSVGVKYYQGNRSPNWAERNAVGYSSAWLHHKGRNRHHFEYWTDCLPGTSTYVPLEMPRRYLAEMVMDRIAACKTYHGAAYTDADPLNYLYTARESTNIHPATFAQLEYLLAYLKENGEAALCRLIRTQVLSGAEFSGFPPLSCPLRGTSEAQNTSK